MNKSLKRKKHAAERIGKSDRVKSHHKNEYKHIRYIKYIRTKHSFTRITASVFILKFVYLAHCSDALRTVICLAGRDAESSDSKVRKLRTPDSRLQW